MRKYRGKRKDNGEWIYGYLIGKDVIVGDIVEWDSEYFCTEFWYKVDPETVGQYTGIHDLKGKEYCEGDIFNHSGRPMTIEWSDINAQFAVASPRSGTYYLDMNMDLHEYEIIGNIHDNPKLVNK